MSAKRVKFKRIKNIVVRLFLIVIFITIALFLVAYAQGFKFNSNKLSLESTGAIYLNGELKDVRIVFDGKEVAKSLPLYIKDLKPNNSYDVLITKDGYHNWKKTFSVKESLVESAQKIKLFKLEYISAPSEQKDIEKTCLSNAPSAKHQLVIKNGEIRYMNDLITRLSQDVTAACWFRDEEHIVYSSNNQIRVVEKDGSNDTLIFIAQSNIKSLASYQNDAKIIYTDVIDRWWMIEL